MKKNFILLTIVHLLYLLPLLSKAQQTPPQKMHEVFMTYIQKELSLTKEESTKMKPLVMHYFMDMRKINTAEKDPLLREQKKSNLKITYREQFIPIIGLQRANRYFGAEQRFKKKIKEVLRQRHINKKTNHE